MNTHGTKYMCKVSGRVALYWLNHIEEYLKKRSQSTVVETGVQTSHCENERN